MHPRRETRSLDIRRNSFDRLDRRRSAELSRSSRRYDEPWGAAEKADTRLKCGDGQIHHVHSQVISCWSPVLRDMINLYPTPHLLESTHGLAYLLHVEEDSAVWASALDMMYPVSSQQHLDWDTLERCLLLADKYDMSVVLQRISGSLLDPCRPYSMDPSKPSFALRWLALADRLQLPQVASHIQAVLRPGLTELGGQPDAMSAVLAYAQEHLSKEQLLQLLQITMLAANSSQQQQQSLQLQPQLVFLPPQQSDAQQQQQQQHHHAQTISMALQGWIGQAHSHSNSPQLQQQQQQSWPSSAFNPPVSASCSGTSSPATGDSGALYSDDASSGPGDAGDAAADNAMQDVDGALDVEQQRLAMCMSSGLFASAAASQTTAPAAAATASPAVFKAAAIPATTVAACPVPRFPATSTPAFSMARPPTVQQAQQLPQRQPVPVFGMQMEMRAPNFGFGVNAGSASIADWMRNSFPSQPEGMCT